MFWADPRSSFQLVRDMKEPGVWRSGILGWSWGVVVKGAMAEDEVTDVIQARCPYRALDKSGESGLCWKGQGAREGGYSRGTIGHEVQKDHSFIQHTLAELSPWVLRGSPRAWAGGTLAQED